MSRKLFSYIFTRGGKVLLASAAIGLFLFGGRNLPFVIFLKLAVPFTAMTLVAYLLSVLWQRVRPAKFALCAILSIAALAICAYQTKIGPTNFLVTPIMPRFFPADEFCSVPGNLDHTCIQNAINAASAAGAGTVYIPGGTYTASLNVTLANNVSLLCSPGWASQINFVDDHSLAMIGFKGGTSGFGQPGITNVSISECSFRGTGVTGRTGVLGLASFFNSSNITLFHNQIGAPLETNTQLASSATGAYFENVNNVTFSFNTVDGTQADGVHFVRGTTNGTVIGNKMKYTGDDSIAMVSIVTDDGVNTYPPVSFFTVTGNTIEQNGGNTGGLSPNASGISCVGCTLSTFTSNTVDSPAGPCINITAIIGNVNGVSTRYPFQDIASENTCRNSGSIGTNNAALVMQYTRASRMHHNTVSVHSSDCAFAGGVGKDNIWDDNWLSGCTGRDINAIQTSSTEARLITELWTNFSDGTPARVGISNLTLHHNILSRPTLAAIEIDGEASLNQTGDIVSENQIYNTPANQQGILAIRVNNSQFNNTTCINMNNNACVYLSTGDSDLVNGGMMATGTGASSGGTVFVGMTNSTVENIFARSAGIGAFIDAGGSNNLIRNSDLRGNASGARLIQDTTSVAIDNIEANFTGQRNQTKPDASGVAVLDVATQTLTNKTMTSPVLNGTPSGTGISTFTLKSGTGAGNYSSASASYTAVDGTNLTYTATIPTGWKLKISVSGSITTNTAVATASVELYDGTCGSGTALKPEIQSIPTAAANPEAFAVNSLVTGDGASHTINLCYKTSNVADAVSIINSSATLSPTMVLNLTPAN